MAFVENRYLQAYMSIVANARIRGTGTASHHIVPKSFGGNNDADNLVRLTDREHFICHRLLTKCTSGELKKKMFYALWRMCNDGRVRVSAKTYAKSRADHSAAMSEQFKGRAIPWAYKMRGPRPSVDQTGTANNNHQGTYVTPWGKYESLKAAKKSAPYKIDITTLAAYCRHKNNIVHIGRATKAFMKGKTPRECGFSFMSKD